MKKFLFLLFPFFTQAQIPEYYDGINFETNSQELKSSLSNLVDATHSRLLYYSGSDYYNTWNALLQGDLVIGDDSRVLLIYGYDDTLASKFHRTRDKTLRNTGGCTSNCWEREHVYAQSIANPRFETRDPGPGTDAHNLRAVDRQMNSERSNKLYADDSGNAHTLNSSAWYPGDEWKGDIARIVMYMYIRYKQQCEANNIAYNPSNTFNAEMPDVFLKWNAEDPPTEYELVRNAVLNEMQGNRNPFIDNPYLATLVWGGPTAQNNWQELSNKDFNMDEVKLSVYPNPTVDKITINHQKFVKANLYNINGNLLAENLSNKVDLTSYPAGVYILAIHLENGRIVTHKVIKK